MALTATVAVTNGHVEKHNAGDLSIWLVDVTFDSSYLISGEAFDKALLKLTGTGHRVVHVHPFIARKVNATTTPDNAVFVRYDSTNKLVQAFWDDETGSNSPSIEVDSTTDLSTYSGRAVVYVK